MKRTSAYLKVFFVAAALIAGLCQPAQAARELPAPRLIAVTFYADWCPNCKILDPKIEEARTELLKKRENVLFVTMDFTDKPRIHQSLLLAQALGIGDYVTAQGSATGYMGVLDGQKKTEITRFDRNSSAADILEALQTPKAP